MLRYFLLLCIGLGCTPMEERVPIVVGNWCAVDRGAEVACVVDGDTLDVGSCSESSSDGERIRLLGVSAPEIDHGDGGGECGGEEAKSFLDEVLTGRDVTLQFDMECTDIYQRTLAWVVLKLEPDDYLTGYLNDLDDLGLQDDGSYEVLVNEWLVRAGYAYLYEGDLSDEVRYGQRMEEALEDAERQELGLHASDACTD